MPIKVICSDCGGRGYSDFLKAFPDGNHWERVDCLVCKGEGEVEELSWQEKKEEGDN